MAVVVLKKGEEIGLTEDAELVEGTDYEVPEEPLPTLAYLKAHGYVKET